MGYPYYIIKKNNIIAVSTDIGIAIIKIWYIKS